VVNVRLPVRFGGVWAGASVTVWAAASIGMQARERERLFANVCFIIVESIGNTRAYAGWRKKLVKRRASRVEMFCCATTYPRLRSLSLATAK
jgi:hypothetical protein